LPIIVDSREKKHVRAWLFKRGIRYTVEALKTGDYLFYDKDRNVRILVERKTVSDLFGSFRSGRLKQQMKRMSEESTPMLLVTGDTKELERFTRVDPQIVSKVMSDAIVKYGFKGVIWMVGIGQDTHEKGLVFMADMLKNMELGNLGKIDEIKKKRRKRNACESCGVVKTKITIGDKSSWICLNGCKV